MEKYVIKRILLIIPILLGVILIVYCIMSLTPGDPARQILGMGASQEAVNKLNETLGFNKPFLARFLDYLGNLFQGDLGRSYRTNQPVIDAIIERFPVTLKLSLGTMVMTALIGIPLGVLSAVKQYSTIDKASTFTALLLAAAPDFWLALLMILLFSLTLGWLPANGLGSFKNYIMPVMTQAIIYSSVTLRMTRSTMLEAIRQDYVRTARGKGATEARVIWRHALKNALLPVVTSMGLLFAAMLGGTIIIEQVFSLAGLGTLLVTAIKCKDIPQVMAVAIFLSAMFCILMLIVDLIYALIDPRVKAQYKKVR